MTLLNKTQLKQKINACHSSANTTKNMLFYSKPGAAVTATELAVDLTIKGPLRLGLHF